MYNKDFVLNIEELETIETALRFYIAKGPDRSLECITLLGNLHQQKNWYRPKEGTYISG